MQLRGQFSLTQRPEKQKIYTTEEAAELLNTSCDDIRRIINYYKIDHQIISTKKSRAIIMTYDALKLVAEYCKQRIQRREEMARKAEIRKQLAEEDLTSEAELHPLVTDKRCLNFNWWPDVVPNCFKELDA
jgi:hypothetical protein